jgi:hypothetical protein
VNFPGLPGYRPVSFKITVFHAEKSCYLDMQDSLPAESKSWAVAPAQCHRRIGSREGESTRAKCPFCACAGRVPLSASQVTRLWPRTRARGEEGRACGLVRARGGMGEGVRYTWDAWVKPERIRLAW